MTVLRKIWWVGHKVLILIGIAAMIGVGVYIGRPPEKTGNQPDFIGSEQQQKKRLAVFLDGTWNSIGTNTNVWRMRALCASKGSDGTPQLIYYGLGVNGFIGGAFGQGLDETFALPTNGSLRITILATKSSSSALAAAPTLREH